MSKVYHYIYKTTHKESNRYYVGRHSTSNLNDKYFGSGKWVRSIKDKTLLQKEIIQFYESCDELLIAELEMISKHIGKENCMNFNNSAVGFSHGEANPSCRPETKEKSRQRCITDNPSKRPEVRIKKSISQKGRVGNNLGKKYTDEHKRNISIGRTGIKYSDEGRKKLSDARKKEDRKSPSFLGREHSLETKLKQQTSALDRPKIECQHCNKDFKPHTFTRWHGDKCKLNH